MTTSMKICTGLICLAAIMLNVGGCGYNNQSLYRQNISSVYVEMFDNQSWRRGIEYDLSNALAKRIEAETPYKVVSDRQKADSVISGLISSAEEAIYSTERQTGRALEKEARLTAVITWKNLKTGELLIEREIVDASAAFSQWQNQGFEYGSTLAANKLAENIVELMEINW